MCLLLANALFFHQAAVWSAAWLYRTSYGNITAGGRPRRRPAAAWLDALVMRLAVFVPRDVRLLMVKDLRLFRRDPVQWSQFLIFFGLLGFYFINIRRYRYDVNFVGWWVNMISFLNLAVIGLILSTFTTRFVFPMISLEGRRFWFLGLLPISRGRILWGKFLFAAIGSTVCCNTLIAVSDAMLRIDPWVVAMHQVTCAVLCVGLSAIAVGLGARLPDLREQSPARIAAGFGGTLNLVLSAIYIVVVVLLTAIPCHLYIHFLQSQPNVSPDNDHLRQLRAWMIQAALASVALGLLVTALTLSTGLRAFRKMEF